MARSDSLGGTRMPGVPRGRLPGGGVAYGGSARNVPRGGSKAQVAARQSSRKAPTLYHGTTYPFKPGDVVKSSRKGGASATSSKAGASSYAKGRGEVIPKGLRGDRAPRVFQVVPTSKAVKSPKKFGRYTEVNDAQGFRVVKEVKPSRAIQSKLPPNMKAKVKPSSGRMSSGYKGKAKVGRK